MSIHLFGLNINLHEFPDYLYFKEKAVEIEDLFQVQEVEEQEIEVQEMEEEKVIKSERGSTIEKTGENFPKEFDDCLDEILLKLSLKNLVQVSTVSKSWYKALTRVQIRSINEGKLNLKDALGNLNVECTVEWLINHPNGKSLEYVDLSKFNSFDNVCFEKLSKNRTNIKHLCLNYCNITSDALRNLTNLPDLLTLSIVGCERLEADALKHLVHTRNLQSLDISFCDKLEAGALKHLVHTRNLQSLSISLCKQLEADALKHLVYTTYLQSLNISVNNQLEPDALKHLKHTKNLLSLNIAGCERLEADALKHLVHTSQLQCLEVSWCTKLEPDALKHLVHTSQLHSLGIERCPQLHRNGFIPNGVSSFIP